MKILHLSVYNEPFELMLSGEKLREYRKPSKWILSRLLNKNGTRKNLDIVNISNGYGNVPKFTRKYKGFIISSKRFTKKYSNGLVVEVMQGDIIIKLGRLIESSSETKLF